MSANRVSIARASAVAVEIAAGHRVRIVNTHGGQVVDTWAFNATDPHEHLSMEHSRSANYRILFHPGDRLVSNLFKPILAFIDDTSDGVHDTLHAACSAGSNRFYGQARSVPNCEDNLRQVMNERGVSLQHIPCPWNLFEQAPFDSDGKLSDAPASAAPGDYVELRTEMDLVLVCSACPSTVGDISGGTPRGAAVDVLGLVETM